MKTDNKSLQEQYGKFLSRRAADRQLISFWDDNDKLGAPADLIELTAGMPHPKFFPVDSVDLHLVETPFPDEETSRQKVSFSHREPHELSMSRTFQYAETQGFPQLIDFGKKIIERTNKPAYDNWDVILSGGSCDAMFKTFETLCDENTTVMMDEFTFTPPISQVKATGATVIPLKLQLSKDASQQGIDVAYLTELLDNWADGPYKKLAKPTVLYTISTGQNPTGMTLSMEKRTQIYQLAQKHDFIIVEDDPYGYLRFPQFDAKHPMYNPYFDSNKPLTLTQYVEEYLVKSFLTMDVDGRVIRLETFSKVFAPGLRLSFIVGNKFLVQKILDYAEITTRSPSGVSQAVFYSTIKGLSEPYKAEGKQDMDAMYEGWFHWVMKVAGHYTHRRNVIFKALTETKAYQENLFSILEPSAGMFIDVKVHGVEKDIFTQMDSLNRELIRSGVQVVIGYKMAVDKKFSEHNCDFLRVTLSYAADDSQLIEASHRIGSGIKNFMDAKKN